VSAIRVEVTAEQIAEFPERHKHWDGPVNVALRMLTGGQGVDVDYQGEDDGYTATIGQDAWTVVVDLPEACNAFLDQRWNNEGEGEPFAFDLEVPEWLIALVARAASIDDQAQAVIATDAPTAPA
jgi:hypothetical protein